MQRLGIEEAVQKLNVIHVAGTKGKVRHPAPFTDNQSHGRRKAWQLIVHGKMKFGSCHGSIHMDIESDHNLHMTIWCLHRAD